MNKIIKIRKCPQWTEEGICIICGAEFTRKSNRQKYCKICSINERKAKNKNYQKKYRENIKKVVLFTASEQSTCKKCNNLGVYREYQNQNIKTGNKGSIYIEHAHFYKVDGKVKLANCHIGVKK